MPPIGTVMGHNFMGKIFQVCVSVFGQSSRRPVQTDDLNKLDQFGASELQ